MWNAEWEYRNQETLKQWYDEQQGRGGVRKIICFGCGNVFYTQIESKKYCWNGTCGRLGNHKLQRQRRLEQRKDLMCAGCGTTFTPKRSDAKYCRYACRQRAYRQRVADNPSDQNDHLVEV